MQFRNVSGANVDLPTLEIRVKDGETFEATGQDAKNLADSPDFERVDKPSGKTSSDDRE